jgi:hypothetical protein
MRNGLHGFLSLKKNWQSILYPHRRIGKHVQIFVKYVTMQQFSVDDIYILKCSKQHLQTYKQGPGRN